MRKIIPALFLIMAFFSIPALAEGQKYTCPMHPHYIADRPGSCPICGMDLVALDAEEDSGDVVDAEESSTSSSGEKKILYWQAPMNPNYRSDKPGKSPMGMDLVPVYGNEGEDVKDETARTAVTIAPETIQACGPSKRKWRPSGQPCVAMAM